MQKTTIGILREGKVPVDHRAPFTPAQVEQIENEHGIKVICQKSELRCFPDDEYLRVGLDRDLQECDVLMGVKEIPIKDLIPNKTYLFFSHTTKEQPYNSGLLQAILNKNIRLIDYEALTDENGVRVVAFGRYAGIVGAYNGIKTYGKKFDLFDLRPAHECYDLEDMRTEFHKAKLPAIKIIVTGGGRVAKGAMEVLEQMGIKKIGHEEFLLEEFIEPVYCQLQSEDYHFSLDKKPFENKEFYKHPENFGSNFIRFTPHADLLIAGAFWNPASPVLFSKEEMKSPDFKIKVIADITCDIEGSIPSTIRASTIDNPVYDYDPGTGLERDGYSSTNHVTVMAVDNLPCELPRDASKDFGAELLKDVIPSLIDGDSRGILERGTITKNGKLTPKYAYLKSYAEGK